MGLHQPSDAKHFSRSFISVNRLKKRKSDFQVGQWIMDSGAFTEISTHGRYRDPVNDYAKHVRRWSKCGNLLAAVSQDYMCEPFIIEKTGLSVKVHQRLTIERYKDLLAENLPVLIIPVLQGYQPEEYVDHIEQYGDLLKPGMWVGVGSVCKRNVNPCAIEEVLLAIHDKRPDLRLHGFGIKLSSLRSGLIRKLLYSADSMAWSFAARIEGRGGNNYQDAIRFSNRINYMQVEHPLFI